MIFRISTYILTLPCISHIATFRQNNLIAWKGRPPMSSSEDETGVKLIIIIIIRVEIENFINLFKFVNFNFKNKLPNFKNKLQNFKNVFGTTVFYII